MPGAPEDIFLEGKWAHTARGEDWTFHNGYLEGQWVIIFTTAANTRHLSRSQVWYGDGTVSVAPPMFTQLFTIHDEMNGHINPLVFCLLPRKTAKPYSAVFSMIRDAVNDPDIAI